MADKNFSIVANLSLQSDEMKASIAKVKQNFEDLKNGVEGTNGNLGEMTKALKALKNISFAGKTIEEIQAINKQIGILTDDIGDLRAVQKGLGTEFGSTLAQGLQGFTAVGEIVIGVASAFGVSKEEAEKYQAIMVQLIGVSQAFATVQQVLEARTYQTIAAKIKETAVTVAHSVATKAAAAAQWLLNTAMSLNPISLVVLAIAALVAGFKLAYEKSEAFRAIVQKVWGVIKTFGLALKDYVVDKIRDIIYGLGMFGSAISNLFSGEFKKAVSDAKEGFKVMFGFTERPPAVEAIEEIVEVTEKATEAVEKHTVALKERAKFLISPLTQKKAQIDNEVEQVRVNTKLKGEQYDLDVIAATRAIDIKIQKQRDYNKTIRDLDNDFNNQKLDSMSFQAAQAASLFGEQTAAYKVFASAQAGISTYLAAQYAYAQGTLYGGPILGAIYAAIAVAAGLANIAKINAIKFAFGGIVPGSSYSGDRVPVMANAGEMILNTNQQTNLFSMLNGDSSRGGNVRFEIEGTKLVGVLSNYNRKINFIR